MDEDLEAELEAELEAAVEALEVAKSGNIAPLCDYLKKGYEDAVTNIAVAYVAYPERFRVQDDMRPGGVLPMAVKEALKKCPGPERLDALKYFAYQMTEASVAGHGTLEKVVWVASAAVVTILAVSEASGIRAADKLTHILFGRYLEQQYLRALDAL